MPAKVVRNPECEVIGSRVMVNQERAERFRFGLSLVGMQGTIVGVGGSAEHPEESHGHVLIDIDLQYYDQLCQILGSSYIPQPCNDGWCIFIECKRPVYHRIWIVSDVLDLVDSAVDVHVIESDPLPVETQQQCVGSVVQATLW